MNKAHVKEILLAEKIYIKKEDVYDPDHLISLYTYDNADEFLSTIEESDTHYIVPSNSYHKLEWDSIIDNRNFTLLEHNLTFKGTLRPEQQEAVSKFFIGNRARSGLFQAPPGFGKTFAACNLIAKNNTKTLILTHTKLLFEQWLKEIDNQIISSSVGLVGDGKFVLGDITVAIYKTAYNNLEKMKNEFSTLIVDECLDYETLITTKQGKVKLGKIVNNKLTPEVLTYNTENNTFEYKKVYNWFKNKQDTLIAIGNDAHIVKGTKNHNVYVYENNKIIKKPIDAVTLGSYLVSNKTDRTSYVLKPETLPLILGLIIGDGSLSRHNSKNNIRISITHGEAQKEYLEYKTSIFKDLFKSSASKSKSGYCNNNVYKKTSLSIVDNYNIFDSLYKDSTSKKYIDKSLLPYITAATWAFIYQDDGSYSNGQITLSLCDLTSDSCNLLILSLKQLFGLADPYVFSHKNYKYIRLKTKDTKIFLKSIAKYVHPIMRYKIPGYTDVTFTPIYIESPVERFSIEKVKYKYVTPATNGYRYNISVEDNHNYIANNILVGNCHKAPAEMFSSVVNNINAKVKIGLSATPRRKDGKHVYLSDFFSPHLVIAKDSRNLAVPDVTLVPTDLKFNAIDPKRDWARAINKLCSNKEYQTLIASKAISYIKQGRCPLIIADRVQMLKDLQKIIPDSICVIGESENAVREDALANLGKTYKAILTTKLFDEGISCHRLDTIFFTCPSNNPVQWEQRIGRIERLHPDKQKPLIVDFWLSGGIVARQQQKRLAWYRLRGYNIL
jgi:superfamily II DNA or RNA helicase